MRPAVRMPAPGFGTADATASGEVVRRQAVSLSGEDARRVIAESAQAMARLAFGALIVLSPFRARIELATRPTPPVYGDYTDFLLTFSDVVLIATLGLWLVSLAARPRPVSIGRPFIRWPVVGLLVFAWMTVPFSVDPPLAAYNAARFVVLAALAVYVLNEVDGVGRLALPLMAMVTIQAVVGIGQAIDQRSIGLPWLGELSLDPSVGGVSIVTAADGTRGLRAYGLTDHPNILGGLLSLALLALAAGLSRARETGLALRTVVFALGAAALLLTFSRAAWLALAVGAAVALAMLAYRRDGSSLGRGGICLLAAALFCAPFVAPVGKYLDARLDGAASGITTEVRSLDERSALIDATDRVISDRAFIGVGLGALPLAMRQADPSFGFPYQPAHLVLLDVAAEIGLFGALSYALLLVMPWIALLRRRRSWTPELAGLSGALAALTVVGLFDYYPWTLTPGRIWAWLILGLWAMAYERAVRGTQRA